jgi:hypothetical protein
MKHGSDDMPIACCLPSAELREREATLLAQFRSAVIGTEELRDGYAFRFPGDGKWIAIIAKMIVAERECCPFLTFELVAQPKYGAGDRLRDRPACTKDFLNTVLCKPSASIQQNPAARKL